MVSLIELYTLQELRLLPMAIRAPNLSTGLAQSPISLSHRP